MFSFHKPKVYRSSAGCCICKAKSSSSRFTDSKKYEEDFVNCFDLIERRCGEVCNACVLLVKRWKKLPDGNRRHWGHVVDARAGPGTKSMTKFKSRNHNRPVNKRKSNENEELYMDQSMRKKKPRKLRETSPCEDGHGDDEDTSPETSRSSSPSEEDVPQKRLPVVSNFVDLTIWKRQKICCGSIFVGPCGAVLMDVKMIKHNCAKRTECNTTDLPAATAANPSSKSKAFSDNSSDSGYDDSSNQSLPQPVSLLNN